MPETTKQGPPSGPSNPLDLVRSRQYVGLLIFGAVIGVPIAVIAFYYLRLVTVGQRYFFSTLPGELGFHGVPAWWPLPILALGGLLVGISLHILPGPGGHNPAAGFALGGGFTSKDLPGIAVASLAGLIFGAVVGPEMPLVAIGGIVAVMIVHLLKKDAPAQALVVLGAAGSFAAIATLLGSPLVAAFLLLEAAGIGGGLASVIMLPGLLAAGIGALIFTLLTSITNVTPTTLAVANLPSVALPNGVEFLWAIPIGLLAAVLGIGLRRLAFEAQPVVARRKVILTPVLGLAIGALAILFSQSTAQSTHLVLFSGEASLASLIQHASSLTLGAVLLLLVCKGLAFSASMSGFRGGPVFPAMFLGAAGGIALSHLPGLPLVAAVGMGVGAMTVVVVGGIPLTSVLLTLVILQADAFKIMPVVIVAVAVAYVAAARLEPWLRPSAPAEAPPAVPAA